MSNSIIQSTMGQGIINLLNDFTGFLMVVAPLVAVLMIIYYTIRKKLETEDMENIRYTKKIKGILIACIFVFLASGIMNLLLSYFGYSV